ncbi:arsenate reductase (glutaredoxin) [Poseidonibacter ostreae]|jgi:arsenate reductase (glutaredoxin)|uniref:Arsenate reductase (Glutaredoxin) n=1 Tax=Poseidonibacter ostreae TaxID=2654171 RepID=A0A6L4WPV6_9BACT|nr:arsenate reductase (glutaredoxin) [Poseidonibacter ostreae]KAB7886232.1 arsenate reductase (glutaredoxin) [Poseidonibacter ostreae]KAB7886929.1 arsenate reductase (glutaredoxin) [Poseidonibacter ostreae]KAB7892222.1 arsenate reductase (glutaredoxin) [Poseidonibacter ostreae]
MEDITIWHNPRCSKSRNALNLIEEKKINKKVFKYLEENPSKEQITNVLKLLKISAKELLRTGEKVYKELDLKNVDNEDELITAMYENPKLIERPIIIIANEAVIARPIENMELLLKKYM